MATLSLAANVDLVGTPVVQVVVTDTGTPAITAVTVTRTDALGNVARVRTEDGSSLALNTSGSVRVGTLYDYEAPFGVPVTYSTTLQPLATSAAVTVDIEESWLIHPGVPERSMPIVLLKGSFDDESEDVLAGVFFPLGRRNAVAITDGKRKAPSGSITVETADGPERNRLKDLLADAFPLLLNVPPSTGLDVDTAYVHIGAIRRSRPSSVGSDPQRNWTLPYQVVDMPVGGSQSQWTWTDVIESSPSWTDLMATRATWSDVLAPTN